MVTAIFTLRNWTLTVTGRPVYNLITGPEHRLDVGVNAKGDAAARSQPHGIVGQSFASSAVRNGKVGAPTFPLPSPHRAPPSCLLRQVDVYPDSGEFTTSAMAEGAIDGSASDYEVATMFATEFAFSRFNAAERSRTVASSSTASKINKIIDSMRKRGSIARKATASDGR